MLQAITKWLNNRAALRRETYDTDFFGTRHQQHLRLLFDNDTNETRFQEIEEEDLYNKTVSELGNMLIKSNPTISRIYDDFVTFATLEVQLTCENPRGQRILDDFQMMLSRKRNPLSSVLSKVFGSIILHGTYCYEITFDDMRQPENIFVIDPDTLYFKYENEVWELGQYSEDGDFMPLSPDRVFYDAINPLIGEQKGHSMIAPAYPSAIGEQVMLQALPGVVTNQAWLRRFIRINDIAMRQANFSPKEIKDRIASARRNITKAGNLKDPKKVPVFTGEFEMDQLSGASALPGGFQFVDTLNRIFERKMIQGGGTMPFSIGNNEFVAESSARTQAIRESIKTEALQSDVENEMGRALSMPLQAQGITDPAVLALKRIDVMERDFEAMIFQNIASGVKSLTDAGAPLSIAMEMFVEMTNVQISEELKAKLESIVAEPEEPTDDEPMGDEA